MKRFLFLLVSFFSILHIQGQNDIQFSFDQFEKEMYQFIKKRNIPSITVAVAKGGKIIYENAWGYADIEKQKKATINTSYQLASTTKPITATAIMMLHEKGMIDIHSSVEEYISPLFIKTYSQLKTEVTISNLLNHTSGLGTYFQLHYHDEDKPFDSFEEAFKKYGTLFQSPGVISEYSNLGYGLLDYIIEKQTKLSYASFLMNEIFIPLGMNNSFVATSKNSSMNIAQKYDSSLKLLPKITINTKGAGSVYASVHDLILFGMFHLKNKKNILLQHTTIDLMQSYIDKNVLYHYYDDAYYGLGWYFKLNDNGVKTVWHEGGMTGASSMLKLIPEQNIAIAVITNTFDSQSIREITHKLNTIVMPKYNPSTINETSNYRNFTSDASYLGTWKGTIEVEDIEIPCTLKIQQDGMILIDYLDFTYSSYFTQGNPIPNKSILLTGIVNKNSFIGMFPGNLPSKDINHKYSQFMSLKLYKKENSLSGTIIALPAAEREYYAYPYRIRLKRLID